MILLVFSDNRHILPAFGWLCWKVGMRVDAEVSESIAAHRSKVSGLDAYRGAEPRTAIDCGPDPGHGCQGSLGVHHAYAFSRTELIAAARRLPPDG